MLRVCDTLWVWNISSTVSLTSEYFSKCFGSISVPRSMRKPKYINRFSHRAAFYYPYITTSQKCTTSRAEQMYYDRNDRLRGGSLSKENVRRFNVFLVSVDSNNCFATVYCVRVCTRARHLCSSDLHFT